MNILREYLIENSVITNKDAEKLGVGRHILSDLAHRGVLERIRPGVYQKYGEIVDDFILISSKSKRIVFSHQTALYLHNLSDRTPNIFYISVPQGYNASNIKKRHGNVHIRYVKKDWHAVGIINMKTPMGSTVQVYNLERTICDIILDRERIDKQIFTDGLKRYFGGKDRNLRALAQYGIKFNIEDEVRRYMEVLL